MKPPAWLFALCVLLLPEVGQAKPAFDCAKLKGARVDAAAIGLPTKGAVVTAAVWTPAEGAGGGYCLLSGEIRSIDPNAQDIGFQLALPDTWNGKAAMLGGGGFNGVIPAVAGNVRNAPADALTPLARGYAVFASDSGHRASVSNTNPPFDPESGDFLANDEQYRNYIGDALKKTHDAAVALIEAALGRRPERSYFFGSSKGGTEALLLAGRWPQDWDGIVALYPGRSFAVALLGQLAVTQALAAPGAYLDMPKRDPLHRAALAACDGLDGVRDGIISNVAGCYAVFDPRAATLDGAPVRCPAGRDTGESCLSDAQIHALEQVGRPLRFDFPVAGSEQVFLGFNILTADLGGTGGLPLERSVAMRTIGLTQPTSPPSEGNSASVFFSDRFLRSAVAQDPRFDQLRLDIARPGPLAARLSALIAMDQVAVDLTAFHDRQGKLIIVHGADDMLSSSRQIELYSRQVAEATGPDKVRTFLRFYEIPGFGHNGGATFNAVWDQVTALENWVETGRDPASGEIVTDITGVPGRTRPLCPYPAWPKYKGRGDPNSAASFDCATP